MTDLAPKTQEQVPLLLASKLATPAGLQATNMLAIRRLIVLVLNTTTWLALVIWAASIASAGGWTLPKLLAVACFAIGTPWPVLGFWNACLGLWLLHGVKDPLASVAPFLSARAAPVPLTLKTAVLMTVRNEDPARALQRLQIVKDSLSALPDSRQFAYFIYPTPTGPKLPKLSALPWRHGAHGIALVRRSFTGVALTTPDIRPATSLSSALRSAAASISCCRSMPIA